jgi:hypothetical protein
MNEVMKRRMINARMVINFVVEAAMHGLFLASSYYPGIRLKQRFSSSFELTQQESTFDYMIRKNYLKTKFISHVKQSLYVV